VFDSPIHREKVSRVNKYDLVTAGAMRQIDIEGWIMLGVNLGDVVELSDFKVDWLCLIATPVEYQHPSGRKTKTADRGNMRWQLNRFWAFVRSVLERSYPHRSEPALLT
jgi:hypothetical protein